VPGQRAQNRRTASVVSAPDLRVRLIARHGVGFDTFDVPAMTAHGVLVTNTPDAVRRPVATVALTFVLALAQKLLVTDRLTRAGADAPLGLSRRMRCAGRTNASPPSPKAGLAASSMSHGGESPGIW
jgi:lactate dehydrogenase-like 2-hydroxyacid dehydrogenase